MQIKNCIYYFILTIVFFSCSEDGDVSVPRNLQEYFDVNVNRGLETILAFGARESSSLSYIFYYPIDGASEISYYETDNADVDENDFTNYRRKNLTQADVFGGKLKRFSRSDSEESWCIVTYLTAGKFHKSEPIKLKIQSRITEKTDEITIDYPNTLTPKFTWTDGYIDENVRYFQVISETENENGEEEFISGTFTAEKFFQFYDQVNVTSKINSETPKDLVEDQEYNFTMMGISEDNWVNLIIEKSFIPRNLQEYIDANTDRALDEVIACAASANSNSSLSYIFYYPIIGATDIRIYETKDETAVPNDFTSYRLQSYLSEDIFGGKLERFSRSSASEAWCIVTYLTDGKLHKSDPIRLKNRSKETEWADDVLIDDSQTLEPKFTWDDGINGVSKIYFQVLSQIDDTFISGTYTEEKVFQFYDLTNTVLDINEGIVPDDLVLDTEYNFTMMGVSEDNWVNLVLQKSFVVK